MPQYMVWRSCGRRAGGRCQSLRYVQCKIRSAGLAVAALVATRKCESASMIRIIVGHTHENIDEHLSMRVRRWLNFVQFRDAGCLLCGSDVSAHCDLSGASCHACAQNVYLMSPLGSYSPEGLVTWQSAFFRYLPLSDAPGLQSGPGRRSVQVCFAVDNV